MPSSRMVALSAALRPEKKIYYDGPNMGVTNVLQANDFLRRDYRQGRSI
jgi:hypothetical protein